jgi:predicted membrane-bound mannosyltransferase/DNA-binding beta-propeller fold protein YncE
MQVTNDLINPRPAWLDKPLLSAVTFNWETVLFILILAAAVFTRFYDLETRVMSHDESLHTYYSWNLYQGKGFQHTPLMHGPLQFHIIALSYFLFGDSDFSARLFAVTTSILTVGMMWHFRRYLGRAGALIAAGLLVISPFMLYYGRYVRNESYVGLFVVIAFYAVLKYLDTGQKKYLYYLTIATVLHFTAKETAFIYSIQMLFFLGFLFVYHVSTRPWKNDDQRSAFIVILIFAIILLGAAAGLVMGGAGGPISATEVVQPANPDEALSAGALAIAGGLAGILGAAGLAAFAGAVFFLFAGYGLESLRGERSLDVLILLFTLILPLGSAFVIRMLGRNPLDYSMPGILFSTAVIVPILIAGAALGIWWMGRDWLYQAAVWYAIFVVFYTTIFTNGNGLASGLVGSLGYWLEQQGVRRGSQPWYYYLLIQIPIYEFLPALGSLLALGIRRRGGKQEGDGLPGAASPSGEARPPAVPALPDGEAGIRAAVPLLGFWIISSIGAYTFAGEKMPWLTYHIALPMILLGGWALGQLVERVDWAGWRERQGWLLLGLLAVFIPAALAAFGSLLGANPPFQGSELAQLNATSSFSLALLTAAAAGFGLARLLKRWTTGEFLRVGALVFFGFLAFLTARASFIASYVNYDNATEYLVYAHSAGPVKEVLAQVEEISRRTSGDMSLVAAYDDDVSWPFTWYMRNFPNARYYGANPTRDLRDVPVIIVGDNNFGKIEPVVGQAYYRFEYIRMWWPDQDYFNLTWDRVKLAWQDPNMRQALFNIWLNRDYTRYSQLVNRDMSLANWSPSDRMRLYIRKDVAAQIWEYGIGVSADAVIADPYEGKGVVLTPDFSLGFSGAEPGQFNAPRGLVVAPDGSLYIADSRNHRIQRLAADGTVLNVWGSFADAAAGNAPGGTFNEPWDVEIAPDGTIFVADTWNHRIQKFTADGQFITMWGFFGTGETPDAFWGPRSIAISPQGLLYVTDTGNKRIVVFDLDGNFVSQFGSVGFAPGQFDEPVGLGLDAANRLYVADTWNGRLQVFAADGAPLNSWDIYGWFSTSLDNKPYLAVDPVNGKIYIADPESYRVLEFTLEGEFIRYWGDYSAGTDGFGLVSGLAVDPNGGLWVSDGGNHRLLHFSFGGE